MKHGKANTVSQKERTFHNITSPLRSGLPCPSVSLIFGLPVVEVHIVIVVFCGWEVVPQLLLPFLLLSQLLDAECLKLLEDLSDIEVWVDLPSPFGVDPLDLVDHC
jgi:hypothetical protein